MSPVPFPSFFPTLLHTLSKFRDLKSQLSLLSVTHRRQMEEHISTVSEFCLELLIPLVITLLQLPITYCRQWVGTRT